MSNSFPKTGDGGGSGRVATGVRLGYSTGEKGGWRFTTGGQSSTPVNTYEIFYDVYLKNVSGSTYNYVYRYWYRAVKLETSSQKADPDTADWVPKPNSRVNLISVTDVSVRKSITVDAVKINLPNLPLTGDGKVGSPIVSIVPTSPRGFGWRGAGQGTQVGTIDRGVGRAYFPSENPFGFSGASPAPGNSSGSGGDEDSAGGTEEPGTSSDDPYRSEGPPIPGFDKTRKTFFNPPPVITSTGAYVPVVYDWEGNAVSVDDTEPDTRQTLLGSGSYAQRLKRKATIVQHIKFDDEWRVKQGGSVENEKGKTVDTWTTDQPLVPTGVRYGFRFMYNPSEVSFSMSPVPGIDPGVIISGLGRSFPMGDEDGSSIQITTYLNRIEDMAFLRPTSNGWGYAGVNPYGNRDLPQEHKTGIATRGTGYDLEYLFRTTLGKPYWTQRGILTADVGLILGLPLMLDLGGGFMRYPGRLTGLAYTHMYFTSDMVPTFTQVTMSFTRFPDAERFNDEPNPGGTGNDKPKKKKKPKPTTGSPIPGR